MRDSDALSNEFVFLLKRTAMQASEILQEMKENGDIRAIKVWERQGMDVKNYYGMNLTKLKELAKKIKKNHELALELWETGIHDAKLLATYIDEPKIVTEGQIDYWKDDVDFWDLSDKLCSNLIIKTSFAQKKADEWQQSDKEYIKRMSFILISELARAKKNLDFVSYMPKIKAGLLDEMNYVRDGANYALISVGSMNKELNVYALEVIKAIGKPVIMLGGVCEAPDAEKILLSKRIQSKIL